MTAETVDARGLKCPLPRMKAELALRQIAGGEAIVLLADDRESPVDIPAWCSEQGHNLTTQSEEADTWRFTIEKNE